MKVIYYETHISLKPVMDMNKRDILEENSSRFGFKLAKLAMLKGDLISEQWDTFLSAKNDELNELHGSTLAFLVWLQTFNFYIERVKFEAVLLDTKDNLLWKGVN